MNIQTRACERSGKLRGAGRKSGGASGAWSVRDRKWWSRSGSGARRGRSRRANGAATGGYISLSGERLFRRSLSAHMLWYRQTHKWTDSYWSVILLARQTSRTTVCLKNIPNIFSRNSRKYCRIFIIFGICVTDKVSNQYMLLFPTTPN